VAEHTEAVREADVYQGEILAGFLDRMGDAVRFSYDPGFLSTDPRPVATTLPLRAEPYRATGGAVPPFFAGLLPEGRRLNSLHNDLKASRDDELSQLIAVGWDCVGDVRVLPTGADPSTPPGAATEVLDPATVLFSEVFDDAIGRGAGNRDASVPGVQDKLSDSMISIPTRIAGAASILKLNPVAYPRLVENEAFFLDAARVCGLTVPPFQVIHDRERFDRVPVKGGTLRRIAQEDATQLAGRWPVAKYRMSTREVFDVVCAVTTTTALSAARLVRQFVFSYAIGNGDLHAKNVSVFNEPDGVWSVTPAYDLLSTLPYGDDRMALQFEGRDMRITGSMFRGFAELYELRPRVITRILDDVVSGVGLLLPSLGDIGLDARATARLEGAISDRLARLRT
jgi:serine/threonine-protein kinase HipA